MRYALPPSFASLALGALIPAPLIAHAEVYLTEDQVGAALLPGQAKLARREFALSDEQVEAIENASGERVRNPKLIALVASNKDAIFIDQVLGKHEQILYAAAISAEGKVLGIEIMEYRETYGHQIRGTEWRRQFVGKGAADPIKLEKDIKNISGATLSSLHVAAGVRRLVHSHAVVIRSL
jgi:Na+-translocating ferredoxin:NAD+ oxidoreductase RnfG subunit